VFLKNLYMKILEFYHAVASQSLRLLWVARDGLEDDDLCLLLFDRKDNFLRGETPTRPLAWVQVERWLDLFAVRSVIKGSSVRFRLQNAAVRDAVERAFLADESSKIRAHRCVAEYLMRAPPGSGTGSVPVVPVSILDSFALRELPYHLARCGLVFPLALRLTNPEWSATRILLDSAASSLLGDFEVALEVMRGQLAADEGTCFDVATGAHAAVGFRAPRAGTAGSGAETVLLRDVIASVERHYKFVVRCGQALALHPSLLYQFATLDRISDDPVARTVPAVLRTPAEASIDLAPSWHTQRGTLFVEPLTPSPDVTRGRKYITIIKF
jgi:hypothetical protein